MKNGWMLPPSDCRAILEDLCPERRFNGVAVETADSQPFPIGSDGASEGVGFMDLYGLLAQTLRDVLHPHPTALRYDNDNAAVSAYVAAYPIGTEWRVGEQVGMVVGVRRQAVKGRTGSDPVATALPGHKLLLPYLTQAPLLTQVSQVILNCRSWWPSG